MIPGITTDYAATNLSCNDTGFVGLEAFVGGASDGKVGAAAMRYTNPYTGTLSFQKAWFFFDDDVQHIMLPFAISNSSNSSVEYPVISVLDQKRLNGPVYVDGKALTEGGNFSRPTSLWHDHVGYSFDYSTHDASFDLAVDFGARSGDWANIGISTVGEITVDLFSAWINHGVGALLDLPVAYTAFPATSQSQFAHKRARVRDQLCTARNDDKVSAVYDGAHRTAMAVFWVAQGGVVTFERAQGEASITIAASANAVVIYNVDKGEVTVADPSQTLQSLVVTLKVGGGGSWPEEWKGKSTKTLEFVLPLGGIAGQSVTQKV